MLFTCCSTPFAAPHMLPNPRTGQLGNGDTRSSAIPVTVTPPSTMQSSSASPSPPQFSRIAAGGNTSAAIDAFGMSAANRISPNTDQLQAECSRGVTGATMASLDWVMLTEGMRCCCCCCCCCCERSDGIVYIVVLHM
jgi:hypothetical protein